MAELVDAYRVGPRFFCASSLVDVNEWSLTPEKVCRSAPLAPQPALPCSCTCSLHLCTQPNELSTATYMAHHKRICAGNLPIDVILMARLSVAAAGLGKGAAEPNRVQFHQHDMQPCTSGWEMRRRSLSRASPHLPPPPPASQLEVSLQPLPPPPCPSPLPRHCCRHVSCQISAMGEAPHTNRGTCHVGEAPPTNRGIRHVDVIPAADSLLPHPPLPPRRAPSPLPASGSRHLSHAICHTTPWGKPPCRRHPPIFSRCQVAVAWATVI